MTDDRFIVLLSKKFSDEISADEKDELQDYLTDETYAKRYDLYTMYWSEHSSNYINNEALFQKVKLRIIDQEIPSVSERSPYTLYFLRSAAAIILLAICSVFYYTQRGSTNKVENNQWVERATARGSKMAFILPDGTHISMNSVSRIRFPKTFSGKIREVYLTGEAFFDVKRDAAHPFIIHAGKMNVKVLGTAFNVKAYPNDPSSETTLIRGLLEVTLRDRPADKIILNPTEKLIVNYSNRATKDLIAEKNGEIKKSVALTQITNMQKQNQDIVETSWVKNRLVFKDEDFAEVVRILERWYNVDIHIDNERLKVLRFSSIFENETLDEALKALQVTEAFHYKIEGKTVTIY